MKPEERISAYDGLNVVLVDGRVLLTDSIPVRTVFVSTDDRMLVQKGYPVVWDDRSKEQSVGSAAFRAFKPADPEEPCSLREEDSPIVISMDGETARVSTGTLKLVELEAIYDGIVIILRKLVVITDRNEYHGLVWHSPKQL